MLVVLVHGWSVYDTKTYGELPARLAAEAKAKTIPDVQLHEVWLGKYVSFRDEVRVEDLARGFDAAFRHDILPLLGSKGRFACITHSTGGPVVRHWWQRIDQDKKRDKKLAARMSHLIMLAPANFGSALAQLGKGRLSRLRSWSKGVEPGVGVLDWLEHGSPESWDLNRDWTIGSARRDPAKGRLPLYTFVLTGQTIDRSLYDHVNSYTAEMGSDGTVRVAAANMNTSYVRLEQSVKKSEIARLENLVESKGKQFNPNLFTWTANMKVAAYHVAAPTACKLVPGVSHVGQDDGILFSIKKRGRHESVSAIVRCLSIEDFDAYDQLREDFAKENVATHRKERVDSVRGFFRNTYYFRDAHSLMLVKLRDDRGHAITSFDFKLTGKKDSPDGLPPGFFVDRQRNRRDQGTLAYFVNHDRLTGMGPVRRGGRTVRGSLPRLDRLGFQVFAYPLVGYTRYYPGILAASQKQLADFIKPDQTTMIEVVLKRIVHRGSFELVPADKPGGLGDFRDQPYGDPVDD